MLPRLSLLIALFVGLVATPAAAGDGLDTLYGPEPRGKAAARRLIRQLDGGPDASTQMTWFAESAWSAEGAWSTEEERVYLVGSAKLVACRGRTVTGEQWERALDASERHASVQHWKAARGALEEVILRPECVDGPLGPMARRHAALLNFARAAWNGYPQDQTRAREALVAAVQLDPGRSWPHPTEVELEKAYWEVRNALVFRPRATLLVVEPDGIVTVDGEPVQGYVELVPGPHVVQIRGATLTTGVLEAEGGAQVVLGRRDHIWALLADLEYAGEAPPSPGRFARAALHAGRASDFWLVDAGRAAKVDSRGEFAWPWYSLRFLVGASLGYRFHRRSTDAPVVVSQAPTDHWVEPRVSVGFRGRPQYGAPALALVASGSLMLAGPVDLGQYGKHVRVVPTVRIGPTLGMATGSLRVTGALYAEALFVGSQVVKRATEGGESEILTRPTVFLGVGAEAQAALRLTRNMWLTLQGGGGWAGSPTFGASMGLEIRVWAERR